ncbi:hypothetical protein ACWCW7_08260 [Nocardia tengchongensis]
MREHMNPLYLLNAGSSIAANATAAIGNLINIFNALTHPHP